MNAMSVGDSSRFWDVDFDSEDKALDREPVRGGWDFDFRILSFVG
jgi:hypothetical protein